MISLRIKVHNSQVKEKVKIKKSVAHQFIKVFKS